MAGWGIGLILHAYAVYSEKGEDYQYNMERLLKKFATAATMVPQPVLRPAAQPTEQRAVLRPQAGATVEGEVDWDRRHRRAVLHWLHRASR